MSYTCPVCHRTSYNPHDERYGYCGHCRDFTRDADVTYRLGLVGWLEVRSANRAHQFFAWLRRKLNVPYQRSSDA